MKSPSTEEHQKLLLKKLWFLILISALCLPHWGGCWGWVPGVRPPPPSTRWPVWFSNTTGILPPKNMWFIGVEVEQETGAPPHKKIVDPPLHHLRRSEPTRRTIMEISEITLSVSELSDCLTNLDVSHATGPDGNPVRIFKECGVQIAPNLCALLLFFEIWAVSIGMDSAGVTPVH